MIRSRSAQETMSHANFRRGRPTRRPDGWDAGPCTRGVGISYGTHARVERSFSRSKQETLAARACTLLLFSAFAGCAKNHEEPPPARTPPAPTASAPAASTAHAVELLNAELVVPGADAAKPMAFL